MASSKRKRRKNKKVIDSFSRMTFSKRWMSLILTFSIIWISLSYILAFLDKSEIAQDLSQQIVIVVISSLIAYFAKSYFETKEEEQIKLAKEQLKYNEPQTSNTSSDQINNQFTDIINDDNIDDIVE